MGWWRLPMGIHFPQASKQASRWVTRVCVHRSYLSPFQNMRRVLRNPGRLVRKAVTMLFVALFLATLWGVDVSMAFSPPLGRSSSSSSSSCRRTVFNASSTTIAAIRSSTTSSTALAASTPSITLPVTTRTGNKRLAAGMAALTGWADVVLNIKLGTFCTMMTGNTMWLAKAFTDLHWSNGVYYATVISSYLVGLAFYRTWQNQDAASPSSDILSSSSPTPPSTKTRFLVKIGASVVVLFVLADVFLHTYSPVTSLVLHKWVPASLLAGAFALINGVGIDTAGTMTFVVTGHLTKLIHSLVDTPLTQWTNLLRTNGGIHMNLSVITGFFVGALWGNILRHLGLLSANFTYMGILLGSLFLWKDSILHRAEGGGDSTLSTIRWYKNLSTGRSAHQDTEQLIESEVAVEVVTTPLVAPPGGVVVSTNIPLHNHTASTDATDMDSGSRGTTRRA